MGAVCDEGAAGYTGSSDASEPGVGRQLFGFQRRLDLGLMSDAFRPEFYSERSNALNLAGARNETLWMIRLMVLVLAGIYGPPRVPPAAGG